MQESWRVIAEASRRSVATPVEVREEDDDPDAGVRVGTLESPPGNAREFGLMTG